MDVSAILGGVASGGLGMIGNLIGAGQQYRYQKKLMNQAADIAYLQAEEAYARNEKWQKWRDQYEDPSAQRARLAVAGINPFVSEGSGVSAGAMGAQASQSAHGSSAPVAPMPQYGQALSQMPTVAAQLDVLRSQAELNRANAKKIAGDTLDPAETLRGQQITNNLAEQRVINERLTGRLQQFDLDFKEASRSNDLATIEAKLANIRSQNDVLNADLQNKLDQHENNPYIRQEIQSRIFMNVKQSAMLEVQRDLLRKNIEVADTDIWLKLAEASNLREMNEVIRQQGISAKADAELKAFEAEARTGAGTWSGRGGALFVERLRNVISSIYGGKR